MTMKCIFVCVTMCIRICVHVCIYDCAYFYLYMNKFAYMCVRVWKREREGEYVSEFA